LPAPDSDVGPGRSDCHRCCGHFGSNDCRPHRASGRRDDSHCRRARLHLPPAPEGAMNAAAGSGASLAPRQKPVIGPSHPRLRVEQVTYAYAATDRSAPKFTLGATSFEAQQREIVAILGPNASGKSTLLRLLAGITRPLSGRIEIDGTELGELDLRTR